MFYRLIRFVHVGSAAPRERQEIACGYAGERIRVRACGDVIRGCMRTEGRRKSKEAKLGGDESKRGRGFVDWNGFVVVGRRIKL